MLRLLPWLLIAWPLPARIAGAFGWTGVWGSGSALLEFLIPRPVAGGVLHVPSFVVCGLIVLNMHSAGDATAARMRAFLIGAAVAGLLLLLRLDHVYLAMRTSSSLPGGLWQENPLGLFVLSDALLALAFTAIAPQRPWLRLDIATVLLALLPVLVPLGMTLKYSPAGEAFLPGAGRQGPARGDAIEMVFTSLDVNAPDFRARAEAWTAPRHPRLSVDSDDTAFLFTPSLDAARRFDPSKAATTLCLYEDGTPPRWLAGQKSNECFESHVTFSERFSQAYAARPAGEPPDLKHYMARKGVCVGVKPIPPSGETGGLELSSMRICSRLEEAREKLRLQFPEAAAMLDASP